jgi:hypothetical protein
LRKDKETLSIFAHYFKSLEHRRLEQSSEEIKRSSGASSEASQGAQKGEGKEDL